MTSLFALRAILFAGGLLTGSLVIVALGWLAAARKAASARHLAWTAVVGALLALPLLAAILPSLIHIHLPGATPPAPLPAPMSDRELLAAATQLTASHETTARAPSGFAFDFGTVVLAFGALWLLGVCVVALRFAASALCLVALTHRSRPFALAPEDEPKIAAHGQECELRLSDRDAGPLTWGIFRPVVLLPHSACSWPRERMQAVLLHELAHIRRRDSLTLMFSQIACALYWPNPLVWMAARSLRREAEIAADDWVIVAGVKPSHYAGELVALARTFRTRGPAFANLAVSMASPGALEARVKSLLSETQARTGVTTMDVWKIAGAGFFAATAVALACPSLAQETQPQQQADQALSDAAPALPATTVAARALPPVDMGAATNPPATAPQELAQVAPAEPNTPEALPAPPAAPDAPPAPPAPPAPAAAPDAPPAPPAPPAPAEGSHMHVWVDGHEITGHDHKFTMSAPADGGPMHVWVDGHEIDGYDHKVTPEERAQIRAGIEKANADARAAMQKAGPEIRRALEQARAGEEAARAARPAMEEAMREVQRHRAEIARATAEIQANEARMHDIRPQIDAAMVKVHAHQAEIDQAMASIQPKLEEALAKVRADLASQHLDANIQARVDEALKRAEIRIQMETARDRERAEHEHNVIIRETDSPNGDRTEERTETDGK